MDLPPYRTIIRKRGDLVFKFIDDNPNLFVRLTQSSQEAFVRICISVSHWTGKKAYNFFIKVFNHLESLEKDSFRSMIIGGAMRLTARNWSLAQPYFDVASALPRNGDYIEKWTDLAWLMAILDIDIALTFIKQTPSAIGAFGADRLFLWGQQAIDVIESEQRAGKAVKAYLKEAVDQWNECMKEISDWTFPLEQAVRIAKVSPLAAESFIRHGTRVCSLLNDQETEQWIAEGLKCCQSHEERIQYFSGVSFKAVERRDKLTSAVPLEEKMTTLSLICEAYLGRSVRIRANSSLMGVRGFSGGAATDGRTIYLPETLPTFSLFKLMALHQASLLMLKKGQENPRKTTFDPIGMHIKADQEILQRFPTYLKEMKQLFDDLPLSYPSVASVGFRKTLPWWGDFLPSLIRETETTVQKLTAKAEDRYDIPPEVIENLLSHMISEGRRDDKKLWEGLQDIFDNMAFASPDAEELQESFKTFLYKEWDMSLADYKMDWCMVRQRIAKDSPNPFVEDTRERLSGMITLIRRQFMRLKPERFKKYRAQPMGDGLDIDALVQAVVEMQAGSFLSENVYVRRDKRTRNVAVLFLVDMSVSTEMKVNGRRVIDIQKEAMALMAEALNSLGDPFAILGFSSEGRYRVDLFTVKDFGEPYGERVQNRLGSLEPMELTRLGTVIRHGIYKLNGIHSLIKLMVILTDGRPYDLEYGNLSYAIADTKKALQEARQHRIHPFIITSDQKGSDYMKWICPLTQSIVVPRVEQLPLMLPAVYKRLTT